MKITEVLDKNEQNNLPNPTPHPRKESSGGGAKLPVLSIIPSSEPYAGNWGNSGLYQGSENQLTLFDASSGTT